MATVTTLYGVSQPGIADGFNPAIVRTYSQSQLTSVASTLPVIHSFSTSSCSGIAANTTTDINGIKSEAALIPDKAGVQSYVCWKHEPENQAPSDTGDPTLAQFLAGWPNWSAAIDAVNRNRTHTQLLKVPIFTGDAFLNGDRNGVSLTQWMAIPASTYDLLGADPYHNLAEIAAVIAFAQNLGVPWLLGEFGYSASVDPPAPTATGDAAVKLHMQQGHDGTSTTTGFDGKAVAVCWFDNNHNKLTSTSNGGPYPKSLAQWQAYEAGVTSGTIGGTFSNAGTTAAGSFTLPAGASAGDLAVFLISWGGSGVTLTGLPNGVTAISTPAANGGSLNAVLYQLVLGAAGSGTGPGDSVTFTLSSAHGWAVGGITTQDDVEAEISTLEDSAATTTPQTPAITAVNGTSANPDTIVAFVATRDGTAGGAPTFTPTSAATWTEDVDRFSSGAGTNFGAYVMHRAGLAAGVSVPASSITSSGDAVTSTAIVIALTSVGGGTADAADSLPLADAITRGSQRANRGPADSIAVAEAISRLQAASRLVTDSVPVSDVATASRQARQAATADTVPAADAVTRAGAQARAGADSVPVSEALTRLPAGAARALTDLIPLADSAVAVGISGQGIHVPVSSGGGQAKSTAPSLVLPTLVGGEVIFCDLAFNLATGALTTPPTVNGVAMTLIGSGTVAGQLQLNSYAKVATAADSGATVTAALSSSTAWEMIADAYMGASHVLTDHVYAVAVETVQQTTHTAPTVTVAITDSWLREVAVDKFSPPSTSMTPASPIVQRSQAQNTTPAGSGVLSSGDSAGIVSVGTAGGDVWTGTQSTNRAITASIAVAPVTSGGGVADLADTLAISDATGRAQGVQTRTTSDVILGPELLTRAASGARQVSDSLSLSDAVTRTSTAARAVTDQAMVTEAITRGAQLAVRGLTDAAVVSDSLIRSQAPQGRSAADTVPLADVGTRSNSYAAATGDQMLITEHPVGVKGNNLHTVADSLPILDSAARGLKAAARAVADAFPLLETLFRSVPVVPYVRANLLGAVKVTKAPNLTGSRK